MDSSFEYFASALGYARDSQDSSVLVNSASRLASLNPDLGEAEDTALLVTLDE